jgi:hypothetical protein
MTYQGRLTDENGEPLNGTYTMTFGIYDASSSGDLVHSERETVDVSQGLFDAVVGPGSAVGGLSPEDLAQPLWLEVQVSDGNITETLSPRQQLYGAPYAFTLLPGTYISQSMDSNIFGAGGATAVLNVVNSFGGSGSNPALPALRVSGDTGIALTGAAGVDGTGEGGSIEGDTSGADGDLILRSNDAVGIYLNQENAGTQGFLDVFDGAGNIICVINESGDLTCDGTKSAVTDVDGERRRVYAMESPEVWFEDFGTASLSAGEASVTIDPQFAQTVNLTEDYRVFVTPLDDCNGLYVTDKTETSFKVGELNGGMSSVGFDYRIIAKRAGYEDARLEPAGVGAQGED